MAWILEESRALAIRFLWQGANIIFVMLRKEELAKRKMKFYRFMGGSRVFPKLCFLSLGKERLR